MFWDMPRILELFLLALTPFTVAWLGVEGEGQIAQGLTGSSESSSSVQPSWVGRG